jgi:hypothetical protein
MRINEKMEREADKIGLQVNEEKTKFLKQAASERTKKFVDLQLAISGGTWILRNSSSTHVQEDR